MIEVVFFFFLNLNVDKLYIKLQGGLIQINIQSKYRSDNAEKQCMIS